MRASFANTVLVVLVLALAAIAVMPQTTRSAVDDPLCDSIVTDNFHLTRDLSCSDSALKAGADGITIDLGGFTVRGTGAQDSIGVNADGHTGVTITNGTVTDFWVGVSSGANFVLAPKMTVTRVTSSENVTHGGAIVTTDVSIDGCTFLSNAFDGLLLTSGGESPARPSRRLLPCPSFPPRVGGWECL